MSARTDLDNSLQFLDDGIKAHVAALAAARTKASDETYLVELKAKVDALADAVLQSTASV
jgi:hypothetical protein